LCDAAAVVLSNRFKQVLPMRVCLLAFRYQGNGDTPCQHDTTRKAIDCATTLPLKVFI